MFSSQSECVLSLVYFRFFYKMVLMSAPVTCLSAKELMKWDVLSICIHFGCAFSPIFCAILVLIYKLLVIVLSSVSDPYHWAWLPYAKVPFSDKIHDLVLTKIGHMEYVQQIADDLLELFKVRRAVNVVVLCRQCWNTNPNIKGLCKKVGVQRLVYKGRCAKVGVQRLV